MSGIQFEEENNFVRNKKTNKANKANKDKKGFIGWFYKKSPLDDKTDKKILEVLAVVLFGVALFSLLLSFYLSEKTEQERLDSFKNRVESTRSVR